jgi:hypothetical protein
MPLAASLPRLCAHCRNPGHKINNCHGPLAEKLCLDTENLANYCVGYNSPQIIKAWIKNATNPQLRILGYQNAIPMDREAIAATSDRTLSAYLIIRLTKFYYTDRPKEQQSDIDAARQALESIPGAEEQVILLINRLIEEGLVYPFAEILASRRRRSVIHTRLRRAEQRRLDLQEILINAQDELALIVVNQDTMRQEASFERIEEQRLSDEALRRPHERIIIDQQQQQHEARQAQLQLAAGLVAGLGLGPPPPPPPPHSPRKFEISTQLIVLEEEEAVVAVECPICYDENVAKESIITTNCGHKFCSTCLSHSFDSVKAHRTKMPTCALCREPTKVLKFNCVKTQQDFQTKYLVEEEEVEVTWSIDRNRDVVV